MQRLFQSFDPIITINSGQTFLWEKHNNSWYGVHGDHIIKISQKGESYEYMSYPDEERCEYRIFRFDDDIKKIIDEITHDPFVRRLVKAYPGLRLMRQQPEQCLFSFLCASNTNIPMIRRMLNNLTRKFGKPVKVDGIEFFTFPNAVDLRKRDIEELKSCGLGYRAKAISAAAQAISSGSIELSRLTNRSYKEAKDELLRIYGIGNKIADCILLFSLEKVNAFPIDVWIARALSSHYNWFPTKFGDKIISPKQYEDLSIKAQNHFGEYAGYAQQYIYFHMRHHAGKKW